MRKKPPCKDCFRRKMLCHTFCAEFQKWKAEDQERKRIQNEAKELEWITYSPRVKKAENKKLKEGRK